MEVVTKHKEILRLRVALIIGALLLASFILADMVLLPSPLYEFYLQNRLLYQIPVIFAVIALSFSKFFYAARSWIFAGLMVMLTFANYVLIYQSWVLYEFAFPYEGTILYAFYCVFALGVNYKYRWVYWVNGNRACLWRPRDDFNVICGWVFVYMCLCKISFR